MGGRCSVSVTVIADVGVRKKSWRVKIEVIGIVFSGALKER